MHLTQDSRPVPYKYKYNGGAELNSTFDVNLYETMFRSYDPQIGRFHQIDPLTGSTSNWSAYTFVQNNPLLYFDPLGLDTVINGENHQWDGGYLDEIIVNGKGGNSRNYSDNGIYWWGNSTPGNGQLGSLPAGPGAAAEQRVRDGLEELERVRVREKGGAGARQAAQGNGGGNDWMQKTQTGLGAFDVAHGAKTELIEYAAKSSKSLNNLKYVKVAKGITKGVAYAQGVMIIAEVYTNSQIKASNVLGGIVTGVSTIPGWGWVIGGPFYVADLITTEGSGQSIGQHLDNAVGGPIVKW